MRPPACHVLIARSGNNRHAVASRDEIRLFARCRNERLRLPAFFQHYRAMGVDRFYIVDNESSDGTTEYLASQPDVHLFRTTDRYGESGSGTAWMNALLAEFGVGCWCVTVDIDELLIFPGSEQTPLRRLTAHLDGRGHDAFVCLMLDLYPAGPIVERFRLLGGTRVVAGSDAHRKGSFTMGLEAGYGVVAAAGLGQLAFRRGGSRVRVALPDRFRTRGV